VEAGSSETQLFAAVRANGSLGPNILLSEEALSGLLAGNAREQPHRFSLLRGNQLMRAIESRKERSGRGEEQRR
jgi:hypothetical protein